MTEKRDFGPKPKLCWLPVNRLTVDMRYQRTLESTRSQKLIDRMVAEALAEAGLRRFETALLGYGGQNGRSGVIAETLGKLMRSRPNKPKSDSADAPRWPTKEQLMRGRA